MPLPDPFQFSQGKLQDYADCPRRFQLRYVLMHPWPALIAEPASESERHMQNGAAFHLLAHQHALGLGIERLAETIHDERLARWWQTYVAHPPLDLPTSLRRAEAVVSAPLAGHRLVAKFDLLAVEPGERLVIVDWKTAHRRAPRAALALRQQTRLYRYLAVEAGVTFNGGQRPHPDQVEMIYWFAEFNGATDHFPYDSEQYAADSEYLADLVCEIAAQRGSTWPLTPNERHCRFCNYRSLCERGVKAGFLEDLEDDMELDKLEIDLEQIVEIEF